VDFVEEFLKKGKVRDEVFIRRALSALYFALFNYWSAKRYEAGKRGKGPYQDSFLYSEFHQDLLSKGLDAQILLLYTYRIAVDHYTLNPTVIRVYEARRLGIKEKIPCNISEEALRRAVEAAREVLRHL